MIERIAILGGSSVYTPEFILSAISHNINVKEIALIGRQQGKLDVVAAFCQRMLDKSGFPARIVATTDPAKGVEGAKYVLNGIRVGGMRARLRDEKLPPKYGMVGDESLGAGGFANAMRTLPVVFDLVAKIEAVNPEAIIINLTNPMGIVVEAITRYSKLQVIGVCDLPGEYIKKIAEVLHCTPPELWVDYIGLNHLGWIQDVRMDNRSCMGQLLERLERQRNDGFEHDLIDLFRMVPTRTAAMFFAREDLLKAQQTCARFRAEVLHEAEKQILKLYKDPHLCDLPELTRERNATWYEEIIVPLIEGLESKEEKDLILCVRNGDAIRDLAEDASVEVPVRISRRGVKPRSVGDTPRFLRGFMASVKESERLTIEAARHKSAECALQALAINPFVSGLGAARAFLDRVLKEESLELH